ncbi:hypothetical protein A4X06_0g1928 [Tilletia controversa]|uniref:Transmembrane protein n=1 Tax=Tilletia controversa TaxID=13291 RepID=A0A8X7SZB4_9BASI|nr:hypothetical protein CF328_g1453 [Tilletia controversa]KAE8252773.1 hypothetical protein A4X06_0g1928 [Tilletia controversa]
MASLDAQQRTEYGAGRTPQPAGAPTQPRKPVAITPKEYEALKKLQSSVNGWRTAGFFFGSSLSAFFCRRKKPPFGIPATLFVSFLGGMGGAYAAMPLGVLSARKTLKQIEDPNHFKQVLVEAMAQKRLPGNPSPLTRPPPGAGTAEAANFNEGGELMDPGYQSASASSSSFTPQYDSPDAQDPPPSGPGSSRWTQIRGERTSSSSTWDRIRKQPPPARASPTSSSNDAGGQEQFEPYPAFDSMAQPATYSGSDSPSASTPYPSSSSSSSSGGGDDEYARQQREFDAMLLRERRMAEENQGAERLGTPFVSSKSEATRQPRW